MRIEPDRQALPHDLGPGAIVLGEKTNIEIFLVIQKPERDQFVLDEEHIAAPVIGLSIDDDLALGEPEPAFGRKCAECAAAG
jgi:hypothetical protein